MTYAKPPKVRTVALNSAPKGRLKYVGPFDVCNWHLADMAAVFGDVRFRG